MKRFQSQYGIVTLTDERLAHILEFHPEIRRYLSYFKQTLARPEHESISAHDASVVICYRSLPKGRRHLAIVLKTSKNPFVLTAYLVKKPKSVTL